MPPSPKQAPLASSAVAGGGESFTGAPAASSAPRPTFCSEAFPAFQGSDASSDRDGRLLPVQLQRCFGEPLPVEQRQPSCCASVFSVQTLNKAEPSRRSLASKLRWGCCCRRFRQEAQEEGGEAPPLSSRQCTAAFAFSVAAAALLAAASGYSICVTAVALHSLQRQFRLCGGAFACIEKGLFIAVLSPGAAAGSLLGGGVADFFGRVFCMRFFALLLGLSTAATVVAPSYSVVLLARAAAGVFVCVLLVAVCAYLAEVASTESRGKFIAGVEICQAAGCTLPYVLGAVAPDLDWRHFIAFSGALILPALLLLPFLVESPVYLLASGKTEAAVSAMVQLGFSSQEQQRLLLLAPRLAGRGREEGSELQDVFQTNAPPTPPAAADVSCADLAAAEASSSLALERETPPSRATQRNGMLVGQEGEDDLASRKKALSSKRGLLWQLALPAGLGVLHNLLFVNSFLLMAPDIILLIGRCDASVAVACVGGAKMVGALISLGVVDKVKRRSLLVFGAAAVACGHFLLSGVNLMREFWLSPAMRHPCFPEALLVAEVQAGFSGDVQRHATSAPSVFEESFAYFSSHASLALLVCLLLVWGATWAVALPLVAAEVSPSKHRAFGVGVAKAFSWGVSALVQLSLEPLFVYLGLPASFLIFSCLAVVPVAFVAVCVRETSGTALDSKA